MGDLGGVVAYLSVVRFRENSSNSEGGRFVSEV
jgi:hypothetical protein